MTIENTLESDVYALFEFNNLAITKILNQTSKKRGFDMSQLINSWFSLPIGEFLTKTHPWKLKFNYDEGVKDVEIPFDKCRCGLR